MTTEAIEAVEAVEAVEAAETAEITETVETIEEARAASDAGTGTMEAVAEARRLDSDRRDRRAERAIAAIHGKAARIERRELDRLIDALDAQGDGDLDEEKRAAVEELADAVVSRLLAVPTRSLRAAAADDDPATIDAALRLFDPDGEAVAETDLPDDTGAREEP